MRKKVVVVYSGGLDSTVLLVKCVKDYDDVVALNFNYGSKHNRVERERAVIICDLLKVPIVQIDLPFVNDLFKSDLLQSGGEIPEGHYEHASMSKTVVPFRNGIMLSIASGYAESVDAQVVAIANHAGDHAIYPDCTEGFITNMIQAVEAGTSSKVRIHAPFVNIRKEDIVKIGKQLDAPMELSWSCYKGGGAHCGKCGTCQERIEAFKLGGVEDPTVYEDDI